MGLIQRIARSNGDRERKVEANALITDKLDKGIVRTWLEDIKVEIEYKQVMKALEKGRC